MVTMVDEIFDRGYQAARSNLNSSITEGLSAIAHTLGDSLEVLHRIEWSAPWAAKQKRARSH
jgi:hypothetical protein